MPRASAQIDLAAYARRNPAAAAALEAQGVPAQAKARAKGDKSAGEEAEEALYASLKALGIAYEAQYPWGALLDPPRRFCADAAIPELKLLLEIDGRAHIAGYARFTADMERRRCAVHAGFVLLAYTPDEAKNGTAALDIQRYLEGRG